MHTTLATFPVALLTALLVATTPAPAGAIVFQVDTTADKPDAQIDGACVAVGGGCTLRAAVQ